MNYHSDDWIMEEVNRHYDVAKRLMSFSFDNFLFGIFYQGSGNYGLDYEDSDVDTKVIMLPTFSDLVINSEKINFTHVLDNEEHIEFKDIRLMLNCFLKQNLNYLEILWTPYKYLNLNFEITDPWNKLIENRELIGHCNPASHIKSIYGIASEKYHALEHHYPSRMKWIDKFGYDPKQLHHLLRLREYLYKYLNGLSCEECYQTTQRDYLVEVKKGYYNLEDARDVANRTMDYITDVFKRNVNKINCIKIPNEIQDLFDDVLFEIMKNETIKRLTMQEYNDGYSR